MKSSQNTKENIWLTERTAISLKVATQQPNPNLNKMNTRKVKRHRNSDTKNGATENHNRNTAFEWSVINYFGLKLVLRRQPHSHFLK